MGGLRMKISVFVYACLFFLCNCLKKPVDLIYVGSHSGTCLSGHLYRKATSLKSQL